VKDIVWGHTGTFKPFAVQKNTAKVTKDPNSDTVVFSAKAAGYDTTWRVLTNANKVAVDQTGKFLIKDIPAVRAGKTSYIDYNDDRILFYPQVHSTDFSAVFLPKIPLGGDVHALKGGSIGFTGASRVQCKWT